MSKQANNPAFPLPLGNENVDPSVVGLSKRELFAAMAMQGLIPVTDKKEQGWPGGIAEAAVFIADTLIKELSKVKGQNNE